jgi:hypothetical protein
MDQPSLDAVVQRLECVERENRRWKVASLLAVVALTSTLLMGQARPSRELVAESFKLVNDRGDAVGTFDTFKGYPGVRLYAPGQTIPAAMLTIAEGTSESPDGQRGRTVTPQLVLSDRVDTSFPGSNTGLSLTIDSGSTNVLMTDRKGTVRVSLHTAADGTPSIELREAGANTIWEAPIP